MTKTVLRCTDCLRYARGPVHEPPHYCYQCPDHCAVRPAASAPPTRPGAAVDTDNKEGRP